MPNHQAPGQMLEVLIGHGVCHAIIETTADISEADIAAGIFRIAGAVRADIRIVPQDKRLTDNQKHGFRCGDNGVFKGMPLTFEQRELSQTAREIYAKYPFDGKYIMDGSRLIICQSNAPTASLRELYPTAEINPLGDWTGGTDVDTGATNRKTFPALSHQTKAKTLRPSSKRSSASQSRMPRCLCLMSL